MSEPLDGPRRGDAANQDAPGDEPLQPRPMIERIGLAMIALVMAAAFGGVAVAAPPPVSRRQGSSRSSTLTLPTKRRKILCE